MTGPSAQTGSKSLFLKSECGPLHEEGGVLLSQSKRSSLANAVALQTGNLVGPYFLNGTRVSHTGGNGLCSNADSRYGLRNVEQLVSEEFLIRTGAPKRI